MTEKKKTLIGVFKVMLLSIALSLPLIVMVVHRWPVWCFDERGWTFLFVLIPVGAVVWIASFKWVSGKVFAGFILTIVMVHAFLLGPAVCQAENGRVFAVIFVVAGGIYSMMFAGVLSDFEDSTMTSWHIALMTFLMASMLLLSSGLSYQSPLYGLVTLLLGLAYLRRLKIKKQPSIARAVLASHD